MDNITILLADDHSLFREGLRSLLQDQADIEIVGEAEDGLEAIRMASQLEPAIILMDINMPVIDGVEATHTILRQHSEISIIILTMYPQDEYVFEALKAGAKAYLLKDTRSRKLLEVIRAVHQGQAVIDPEMTARLLNEFRRLSSAQEKQSTRTQTLTDQERTILTLVAGGASNKDIAATLNLSERTIKNYLSVIFQKLQVNNRTEAAIRAVKDGLVDQ
jgi:NarL family two-component system response regulator LiaR